MALSFPISVAATGRCVACNRWSALASRWLEWTKSMGRPTTFTSTPELRGPCTCTTSTLPERVLHRAIHRDVALAAVGVGRQGEGGHKGRIYGFCDDRFARGSRASPGLNHGQSAASRMGESRFPEAIAVVAMGLVAGWWIR